MTTVAQKMRGSNWHYIAVRIYTLFEAVQNYLRVNCNLLDMYKSLGSHYFLKRPTNKNPKVQIKLNHKNT